MRTIQSMALTNLSTKLLLFYICTVRAKPFPGPIPLGREFQVTKVSYFGFKDQRQGPVHRAMIKQQLSSVPSNCQRIMLLSRTNYFLHVTPNGSISGVTDDAVEEKKVFLLESYGKGIVRLKHELTKKYVTMDISSQLTAEDTVTEESLFFQRTEENSYDTFASHIYFMKQRHDMFLNINKKRHWKKGRYTHPGQRSSQFLVILPRTGGTLC